jgi:quercetin dioxygenase-like cupin family protein
MSNYTPSPLISDHVVRHQEKQWQLLVENGKHYPGVSVISLHFDAEKGRSTTILLKFEAGASYPYHDHPAGEEIFVLEGEAILENMRLTKGDYLYTPPGFRHAVSSPSGCTMLFVVPEEVVIL